MREIGSVAIPPKGTPARAFLDKFLKETETPKERKLLKQLWKIITVNSGWSAIEWSRQ
jgi:hypothetical protein